MSKFIQNASIMQVIFDDPAMAQKAADIQRADPREVLWRLFQEQAKFVIADPTEIECPQAWKTEAKSAST